MTLSPQRGSTTTVSPSVNEFLTAPQTAVLTTLRPDGSPHLTPVRFTWDPWAGVARVLTVNTTRKVRNVLATPQARVALCQVDGFRWVTLEGTALVFDVPERVAEGVRRYAERYCSGPPNPPGRVVVEIAVDRVLSLNC
ncbi:pyridoxamine 5'-phosphate oxidase family protein [Streptomyces sp. KMM 9044]|uniref:pyridoxamine 5'-phosphate oxidase family protein n=1 Tax=Streptomyces sp. KMM 9044 TaxID=2744474 RepID=UPI002150AA07|nr:TIGR03618 family F420-dependent PPOX class oxidoreductase [Streptomyces sp. KMM 9044]WAX76367.1 TIGR03618 family F420-dependent PPOX class oxidoreductase [Streptomyces sp. KMM 9044]